MKCVICRKIIEGKPYKTFGELSYCSRKCWLNVEKENENDVSLHLEEKLKRHIEGWFIAS